MDNQQGPTVEHRKLCSILCNNVNGRMLLTQGLGLQVPSVGEIDQGFTQSEAGRSQRLASCSHHHEANSRQLSVDRGGG